MKRFVEVSESAKSKAEKKFAMMKKKGKKSPNERETEELKIREKIAKLRALRLAKEEADRVAAEQATAEEALARSKAPRKKKASPATG